ncbi:MULTISPECIES: GNAT family N-acetyltransferase [Bacillus amyloliquefaciens group]|uniref:GNAT family N-acetyltransferase n=1 Tax=Bacillus amyloliquefaciens group TaxID=1938374 RepID=UPI0003872C38|nr:MULTISPECIES: GNAT family N-acetyltransferase [Bacillus amyloliquefaciens group]KAF1275146.1 GNAT family N-acetyltransferase [Bacillus amyloliquefaciens]MBC2599880.1 N-acetyltransferase family protein [Bacillus velezensis]MBE7956886.1 N-acetyltransferase [Bacillus amyloliquefaciens]MBU5241571.1 GNAT family N-acetyltransferase [Bacillus velezensis]MCA1233051.1 GNAT family N-acetyltransferase [Bacillus velezensis]
MVSIIRFQILKERELKILEHWFKNDNIRRRMDAMLPLDAWYARLNKDEDDTVIMAYDGECPAGMVSMEFVEERAYIGLIVNPLYQLQGYGKQMLQKLLTDPGFTSVREWAANIEKDNQISLACFQAAGFTLEDTEPDEDGFLTLILRG